MSRKLLKDLSIDELLGMRNAGMTNTDIANALDISYASVYRLIGKQPGSMRASSHTADLPPAEPQPATPERSDSAPEPEAALIVEDRVYRLAGLFASYRVRVKDKEVDVYIDGENIAMTVKFDELGAFASEIAAIDRRTSELRVGCEAW